MDNQHVLCMHCTIMLVLLHMSLNFCVFHIYQSVEMLINNYETQIEMMRKEDIYMSISKDKP